MARKDLFGYPGSRGVLAMSPQALMHAPLRSTPYHAVGTRVFDGMLMTVCGCFAWSIHRSGPVIDDAMLMVAPKVARIIGRPCKACISVLTTGRQPHGWHLTPERRRQASEQMTAYQARRRAEKAEELV